MDRVAVIFIFHELLIWLDNEERRVNALGLKGLGQSQTMDCHEGFFTLSKVWEEAAVLSFYNFLS